MSKELMVAPCSFHAAKFACENFHYSKTMPPSKSVKHGIWEDDEFIGAVVYGDSPNKYMGSPYGLDYFQICELRRVALYKHENPITKILSKSLKLLHKQNPNLELVISYADPNMGHIGVIYQAGNWIFDGQKKYRYVYCINGKITHGKTVHDRYGTASLEYLRENVDPAAHHVKIKGKFKYLYPLTKTVRKKFEKLHQPYPKKEDLGNLNEK